MPHRHGCSAVRGRRVRWRALSVREIETLIYPVGFYRNKARAREGVLRGARRATTRGGSRETMEELVALPGVGRKTANLVLIVAFKSDANICVDTHVHRISNRLGWVKTDSPQETEQALYRRTARALVAADQSVSRHVGTERLPAGASALRGLRDRARLSKNWGHP